MVEEGSGILFKKTSQRSVRSPSRFWRYGPLILWAALIFIGSSDLLSASHTESFLIRPLHWLFPGATDATLATIHFLLRKAGHFTEYAILALLAARAFRTSARDFLNRRWFVFALGFAVLYALFDEFRQSFVPSRTASIYDSLVDSAGALTILVILFVHERSKMNKGAIPERR